MQVDDGDRGHSQARVLDVGDHQGTLTFARSAELLVRAEATIAGGVNSNVRLREQPAPLFFERADGAYLFDADGNRLIDYALGNGPMLLGHRPKAVVEAVKRQLDRGILYAGQHELEVEVAELLVEHIPCASLVRFSQTGTEAILGAIRMARAATGRQKLLKFQGHYHGWADSLHFNTSGEPDARAGGASLLPIPVSAGQQQAISNDVIVCTWNQSGSLREIFAEHGEQLAALVVEPIMSNGCIAPAAGFLELIRELCTLHGVVLIFDEIITGFRFGMGGAQALFGVTPDLAVFGKAMASGFPVSAIAGRSELFEGVIDGSVVHAGTYNGSPVGMAAALATIDVLRSAEEGVYERIESVGTHLLDGLQQLAREASVPVMVQGYPAFSFMGFTDDSALVDHHGVAKLDMGRAAVFMEQTVRRGVRPYSRPAWMLSSAHSFEDVQQTLSVVADVLGAMEVQ